MGVFFIGKGKKEKNSREREFDYKRKAHGGAPVAESDKRRERNTRTTAVFFIKYLRTLGYNVTNDIFAENAWYFRNALVRANYTDLKNDIHSTTEYLELFLENLLLNKGHKLLNRTMHVNYISDEKVDIESLCKGKYVFVI